MLQYPKHDLPTTYHMSWDRSVIRVMGYVLDDWRLIPTKITILLYATTMTMTLVPTQPSTDLLPGVSTRD